MKLTFPASSPEIAKRYPNGTFEVRALFLEHTFEVSPAVAAAFPVKQSQKGQQP